ncbi:MAG: endonuclease III [Candidatus Micrarchaeota archaeon]|nr:endonuclease III [Candidatus Micrarchaeota archaeon]
MEIGRMLLLMQRESSRRGAPVLSVESAIGKGAFAILIFTVLSARTRDETTIKAGRRLLAHAPTPQKLSLLPISQIQKLIYPVGFYKTKAKHLHALAHKLISEFGGAVPSTFESLTSLPGVGRKTANIVLASAFGKHTIGVDTHVHRISNRLGLVKTKSPEKTNDALDRIIPNKYKKKFNMSMVAFGQTVCTPLRPKCSECPITKVCPRIGVANHR